MINSHAIQYFAPLYRHLAKNPAIELTVYYCSLVGAQPTYDRGFGQEITWDVPLLTGYTYVALRGAQSAGPGGFWSLRGGDLWRALLRERYDAIIIHGHQYAVNIVALALAKLVGTKVFLRGENHLGLERRPLRRVLRAVIMRPFLAMCDACLCIGSANADYYRAYGVSENRLFLVPYTVDNAFLETRVQEERERLAERRAELGFPDGIPLLLYLSKLTKRKNAMHLLDAASRLQRKGHEFGVVVVGSGEERGALEQFVAAEGLRNVVFTGFQNQSQIPRYFALASVFVLPSVNEPWGLVVNEAMCAGLPIVATTAVGATRDLVRDGQNGYVYAPGDVAGLAEALRRLIVDVTLRSRMSQESSAMIRQWSYAEAERGILDALQKTVARQGRRWARQLSSSRVGRDDRC